MLLCLIQQKITIHVLYLCGWIIIKFLSFVGNQTYSDEDLFLPSCWLPKFYSTRDLGTPLSTCHLKLPNPTRVLPQYDCCLSRPEFNYNNISGTQCYLSFKHPRILLNNSRLRLLQLPIHYYGELHYHQRRQCANESLHLMQLHFQSDSFLLLISYQNIVNQSSTLTGILTVGTSLALFNNVSISAQLTISNAIISQTSNVTIFTLGGVTFSDSQLSTTSTYCTAVWSVQSPVFMNVPYISYISPTPPTNYNYTLQINTNNIPPSLLSSIASIYSVSIISNSSVLLHNTNIVTSSFLQIGQSFNLDYLSTIDTNGQGCNNNEGAGRGVNVVSSSQCNSSGASGAGYGGYGLSGSNNTKQCYNSIQFFSFILHSFPYGYQQQPFVSGSAGSNPNGICPNSSSGGGMVTIQNANSTLIQGVVDVGGQGVLQSMCSAGSAGSINILTQTFTGSGTVTAVGGDSTEVQGPGEGSGGFIKITSLGYATFSGTVNFSHGTSASPATNYSADNGTIFSPNCPPGKVYIGLSCNGCPVGTYKGLLDGSCQLCPSYPGITISKTSGNLNLASCYIDTNTNSGSDASPKQLIKRLQPEMIGIFVGLIVIFYGVGVVLQKKYKKKKSILETESFDFEKATKDINETKIITQKLKNQSCFKMADLMYHLHRITVFGTNIFDNPWYLSENPPPELRQVIQSQAYEAFAKTLNQKLKWTRGQKWTLYLSYIIYPVYWYLLIYYKKKKYRAVQRFIQEQKPNFINREVVQDRTLVKMKVSKNTDYTICYIDIFRYHKADLKYFMLSCPYIVYLSGEGNFIRPYYLCPTDPFLNALYFIVNRNVENSLTGVDERYKLMGNLVSHKKRLENSSRLTKFLRAFNRSSCTLDLHSSTSEFIHGIQELIELIHLWNKQFFNQFSVQLNLILIVTKFDRNRIIDHQVNILQNGDQAKFRQYMEEALRGLALVDKYDIKFALFIYNPNQDLEDFKKKQTQMYAHLNDRTDMIDMSHLEFKTVNQRNSHLQELLISESATKSVLPPSRRFRLNINRIIGRLRYFFIAHKTTKTDKYTLQFLQIVCILLDASFVTVCEHNSWFSPPYIGISLVTPFVGIIWVASGNSYGVGKIFLILNAMACVNQVSMLIVRLCQWNQAWPTLIILRVIALLLQLAIVAVGCKMITFSKKLNQPKIT